MRPTTDPEVLSIVAGVEQKTVVTLCLNSREDHNVVKPGLAASGYID